MEERVVSESEEEVVAISPKTTDAVHVQSMETGSNIVQDINIPTGAINRQAIQSINCRKKEKIVTRSANLQKK